MRLKCFLVGLILLLFICLSGLLLAQNNSYPGYNPQSQQNQGQQNQGQQNQGQQNQGQQNQGNYSHPRLTPEQKQEVKVMIQEMKANGASRDEIRSAVKEMLQGWGINTPSGNRGGNQRWQSSLTAEQKQELKAKIQEMKQSGSSREEIHSAVKNMLQGWGVNIPAGNRGGNQGWQSSLTAEQKQELKAKIQDMKQSGASREEIHSTIQGMMQGWGVNMSH